MNLLQTSLTGNTQFLDGGGLCGSMVHYTLILGFVGGAFLIFLYLWKKNKLDMDEEPKMTMMKKDEIDPDYHPDDEGDNRGGA
jgi:hypothetical protein